MTDPQKEVLLDNRAHAVINMLIGATRHVLWFTARLGCSKYPRYDPEDTIIDVELAKMRRHFESGCKLIARKMPPVDSEGNNHFTAVTAVHRP